MANNLSLAAHPIIQTTLENIKPTLTTSMSKLKKLSKETGEIRFKDNKPLSEYQFYNVTVFQKAGAITECVSQLEEIIKFIKRFPSPKTYVKEGITHYRWIEYHYSYYIVTVTTLFDLSLILTNAVFRLSIPERLCKPDLIKNNEWIKKTKVNKSFQSLEQIIDRHRQSRNLYIHRRKKPDLHDVFKSDFLDHLALISLAGFSPESVVDKKILDFAFKFETKKICNKLGKEIQELEQAINKLFDSLFPIFKTVARSLQS